MTRSNLLTKIQFFALALVTNFATLLITAQERAADFSVEVPDDAGQSSPNLLANPALLVVGALIIITIIVFVEGNR